MKRAQKGLLPSSSFSSSVILVVTVTLLAAIMTPGICHAERMLPTTTSPDPNSMTNATTNATTTAAPTSMNATVYPSSFPTWSSHHNATSIPSTSSAVSNAPTQTNSPSFTPKPTAYSSHSDSNVPKKSSTAKKVARVIGWMTFLFLSCLAFGMCMSNRYRIYYLLSELWLRIRTATIVQRMTERLGFGTANDSNISLNEIIFGRGDYTEGLLMRNTS